MRRFLGPDDVLATLRLLRSQFDGTWLFVEGSTDAKVLSRFVDPRDVAVQSCQGKRSVLTVLTELRAQPDLGTGLAVVDSDFWWLDGERPPPDVVPTDAHDLEGVLMRSPALDMVLAEDAEPQALAHLLARTGFASIRELAADRVTVPAHLRLVNYRHGLNLRFRGTRVEQYLDSPDATIDSERYVGDVLGQSNAPVSLSDLSALVDESMLQRYDPIWLCQGHDLVQVVAFVLRVCGVGAHHPHQYTAGAVEKDLRLAFDSLYFRRTGVYRGMDNWSARTGSPLLAV